jgi:hypothetical protein
MIMLGLTIALLLALGGVIAVRAKDDKPVDIFADH